MADTADQPMSDAEHVREFTAGAGQPVPDRPSPMTDEETKFITKMIIDETLELLATIMPPAAAKELDDELSALLGETLAVDAAPATVTPIPR